MTGNRHDLSAGAYAPATSSEVRVGDVCQAIALPDPADPALYESDALPGRFALAARIVYALVVSVYEGYVVVVPITTADVVADGGQFAAVVAAGHTARRWITLPVLEGAWDQEAVAMLFMPQTLPEQAVASKRLAAMHPDAREVVGARFADAFSDDGD
jgi:hypothetical protein